MSTDSVVRSRFGPVTLVYRDRPRFRVLHVLLPSSPPSPSPLLRPRFSILPPHRSHQASRFASLLLRFLAGSPVRFDIRLLALDACPAFQRRVLLAESRVPRGRVTTYARLAARVGSPAAARAVGAALSRNPFPLIIPCHRATRSDGSPGGFQGGIAMKRSLLEQEGIRFTPSGRVRLDRPFF